MRVIDRILVLTPGGEDEGGSFAPSSSVEDEDDVEQHLHSLGKHQEERGQEEIVQQNRRRRAPRLQRPPSLHLLIN